MKMREDRRDGPKPLCCMADQGKQVLGKALEQAKERYVCRFTVATAYADLGEKEKALESLEQRFLQRST